MPGRHAWSPCLVAIPGAPHPGGPGLRRHGLCQPLQLCPAQEAASPIRTPHRRGDVPPAQATRAVDRHPRAGDRRPGDLGPSAGATRAQRRAVIPEQHQAQLSSTLPDDLRDLRLGPVRAHLCRKGEAAGAALLPVPRQGLHPECPSRSLPEPKRQGRRDRSRGVGPRRRPSRQPGAAGGAVRPCRRCGRGRHGAGPCGRPAAARPAGPCGAGRQAPIGRLRGRRGDLGRVVGAAPPSG